MGAPAAQRRAANCRSVAVPFECRAILGATDGPQSVRLGYYVEIYELPLVRFFSSANG
jgi:hypothetical protein